MYRFSQLFAVMWLGFLASEASAYVAGGHEYEDSCNADGYVLTSKYPVTRTIGQGASNSYVTGIEKLYLGRSCDAYHAIYGDGQWCWANGGFLAEFEDAEFGFGRQELFCRSDEDLGLECRCQ
ncbi:hypothetical protein SAMN05216227_10816 [Pseudorhodobacter antarcticus]|uniref:Uncharacterized protein n=1 Tax=Pseudorhodobacter antarcticus TaxID=1077947 RepID=A0A1H8NFD1_9RHOB|nr:hypothetical protein [Pseudorhodobacter antarcticus]SEO28232.1 hypothetical protein SAMN05216227_10816 [Pseudorhodobacter antarcticus]